MSKTLNVSGKTCVHLNLIKGITVVCQREAIQSKPAKHGWLCEKHYWSVRTRKVK